MVDVKNNVSKKQWTKFKFIKCDLSEIYNYRKKIGKIDVTKNLLKFEEGKKIKISQKGNTPKFTQK